MPAQSVVASSVYATPSCSARCLKKGSKAFLVSPGVGCSGPTAKWRVSAACAVPPANANAKASVRTPRAMQWTRPRSKYIRFPRKAAKARTRWAGSAARRHACTRNEEQARYCLEAFVVACQIHAAQSEDRPAGRRIVPHPIPDLFAGRLGGAGKGGLDIGRLQIVDCKTQGQRAGPCRAR